MNKFYTNTAPYSKLSETVYNMVEQPQRIFFSIFETMEGEESICRYPDIESSQAVIQGEVQFIIRDEDQGREPIKSSVLNNPNWKSILQAANDMLQHREPSIGFLEDIVPIDAGTYELVLS